MGTISRQYTFIAGAVPTASNWNADWNQILTLVTGQLDKANVDSDGSDGIVTKDETQTITGVKTWSGAAQFSAAVTVGVDDTGYDVKFFGATASAHLLWDESADTLKLVGGAKIDMQGTLTVGVDDTGYDIKFFGASAGAFSLWDESANKQIIQGATAAGPGSLTLTTGELTNVDGGILGRIDFQAPLDSAGTDAILVGASIWAEADATFSSSVNTTDLVFAAATSETAAAVMRMKKGSLSPETTNGMSLGTTALNWSDLFLDSGAIVDFDSGNVVITHSSGVINVSTGALQVGGVAVITGTGVSLSGSTNDTIVTVTGANAMLGEANLTFDGAILEARGAVATPGRLHLTTAELTVVDGNVLGKIDFSAPLESDGTDAIAIAASIWAEANDTFAADNNTTDLVFATGASEIATEKMRIDSTGAVTKPTNPFVSVFNGTQDDNVTGGGTAATINFDTELFDIGANFASDTFTAPVDGKYIVTYRISALYVTTAMDVDLNLITSNRTYRHYSGTHTNATWQVFDGTMLVEMDADDTLTLRLTCSGASDTVDIFGRSDLSQTFMMIQLIQ